MASLAEMRDAALAAPYDQKPPDPRYVGTPYWPQGMITPGNIDLTTRPQVRNPDGSISTVRSMSYGLDNGQEVLVPTVANEGRIMPNREAGKYWEDRGQTLGTFTNPDDADAYAQALHEQQARAYPSPTSLRVVEARPPAQPMMPPRTLFPETAYPSYTDVATDPNTSPAEALRAAKTMFTGLPATPHERELPPDIPLGTWTNLLSTSSQQTRRPRPEDSQRALMNALGGP